MSLYENLIALVNKYFYKTEEKPVKYNEWLTSYYSNGNWYICEDFLYFNDGSDTGLYNPQGATISTSNGVLTITTSTSGEKKVSCPVVFKNEDNVYLEATWCGGTVQPITFSFNREGTTASFGWVSYNYSNNSFDNALNSTSTSVTGTIKVGDVFRLERENGVSKFYQNGTLLFSYTRTFTENYRLGFYTNNGRSQSWKNIKIGYL